MRDSGGDGLTTKGRLRLCSAGGRPQEGAVAVRARGWGGVGDGGGGYHFDLEDYYVTLTVWPIILAQGSSKNNMLFFGSSKNNMLF